MLTANLVQPLTNNKAKRIFLAIYHITDMAISDLIRKADNSTERRTSF